MNRFKDIDINIGLNLIIYGIFIHKYTSKFTKFNLRFFYLFESNNR